MEQKLKLELKNNSIQGIQLTLGDTIKELDIEAVEGVIHHLKQWLSWREHWVREIKWYDGYSLERIKIILDEQERDFDEEYNEYRIGNEFASYIKTFSENGMEISNYKAEEIIKKDWKKEFPDYEKDILFDAELSYCYIYTKKRDVAETFLWWSYNKYIKPTFDLILKKTEI